MHKERMRLIISGLKKFELTGAEERFVNFVEHDLHQDGLLYGIIESLLESIYTQKTEFIRDSILFMLRQSRPLAPIHQ